MKKSFQKLMFLLVMVFTIPIFTNAQFIVKIRPVAPVIVRTGPPSHRHIWIDGEWAWRGGGYHYVNGYWAMPPRYGTVWVTGHWKHTRRGWLWKPGHWRRR